MTLKEFWNSKEKLAINCKTKEQDKIFRVQSDKLGKKWVSGNSFSKGEKAWEIIEESICYSNNGYCGTIKQFKRHRYTVLNFEDINFEISKQQELYEKYGKDNQINIVIEEMSELTKELVKDKRGKNNRPQIVEELADVLFVLEYVKIAFDIKQEELDQVLKNKGLKE